MHFLELHRREYRIEQEIEKIEKLVKERKEQGRFLSK